MMRERYSLRNSICLWPIILASPRSVRSDISHMYHGDARLATLSGDRLFRNEIIDICAGQHPVIVQIGDDHAHEQVGEIDGAKAVAEVVVEDRQRQLLRA